MRRCLPPAAMLCALACAGGGGVSDAGPGEFVASETDFECLLRWERVRRFRVQNRLGRLDQTLAVARGEAPLPYPVGSIVQLIPAEAMVKRGGGFDSRNGDWEYFRLGFDGGTQIEERGKNETLCFQCHLAARRFDFVCEQDHGCVRLSVSQAQIDQLQQQDPRCP